MNGAFQFFQKTFLLQSFCSNFYLIFLFLSFAGNRHKVMKLKTLSKPNNNETENETEAIIVVVSSNSRKKNQTEDSYKLWMALH